MLTLCQDFPLSPSSVNNSPLLQPLLFTSHTSNLYTHSTHVISPLSCKLEDELEIISSTASSDSASSNKAPLDPMETSLATDQQLLECVPTEMPRFLFTFVVPKVSKYSFSETEF